MTTTLRHCLPCILIACACLITPVAAQSVCLPLPRLLTMMPMGGQAGSEVDVVIGGQFIEQASTLHFSDSRITATPKVDANGERVKDRYMVKIAADCPVGIYEASVMTRLGLSASRVFSVGALPEITHLGQCTSIETAVPVEVNSICNAKIPARAVNHYSFVGKKGQRLIIDCAAKGIDSKLNPVLIVADSTGADLVVERRGGAIDFLPPEDATYLVKVHELTFKGGATHFFRLSIEETAKDTPIRRPASTKRVNAFSWPPHGLSDVGTIAEIEPNNQGDHAQKVELPCDISGDFGLAADVDTFEFEAIKGDVWWVEVASERLGRPTDPSIIVQHVDATGEVEKLTDVAELADIASPVKVSTAGYSYDGPPYNTASSDVLGKVEIKQDGLHRLQIRDLFGGTRNDPRNVYRLIVRRATADFALVAWGLHIGLRNGDRNALSKPMALRPGSTIALEVIALRRDGFDAEIELAMKDLPKGVTASGLKIAAGQSRGMVLVTASEDAPRGVTHAKLFGRATIDGESVTRDCSLASMAWPVINHKSEIPSPRLLASISVSVGDGESAPLSVSAKEDKVWEVTEGGTLKIPLVHVRRCEFSGNTVSMKTMGAGFEKAAVFDLPLTADESEAILDLKKLKVAPGEYLIAFYGGAVAKYSHNPGAVKVSETRLAVVKKDTAAMNAKAKRMTAELNAASAEAKTGLQSAIKQLAKKQKAAKASMASITKNLTTAKKLSAQKDIVDIVVSEPIAIRVKPAEKK